MTLTNEERNYLKGKLIELLDEFEYSYTVEALDEIIDTWECNKGYLVEAFKTHPNYIEGKFMIAFDTDYDRDIDIQAVKNFSNWLIENSGRIELPSEIKEMVDEGFDPYLPSSMYFFIRSLHEHANRTISERTTDLLNAIAPEVHAHTGQKTTRVINKLCRYLGYDKVDGYNREYAKYADALTPLKITRHTIISLNPLDYLTMSFGNSWSSCHTIDKDNKRDMPNGYQGMYSSGTMSYMLDESSIVFYTVDSSYEGTDYFTQPKVTRQMYHYGNEKLVQGRLYPANGYGAEDICKQYRNIVQEVIAQIFDIPNFWTLRRGTSAIRDEVSSYGTHYRDYTNFDSCTISLLKGSDNFGNVCIGHSPICIECGHTHSHENTINCCNGYYRCANCGDPIDEEDIRWVDGEPYCCDCADWCECCQEYHRGEMYWVEHYGSWGAYVCESCYNEHFVTCECCNEIVWQENAQWVDDADGYICDHCYNEMYACCPECGASYPTAIMYEHNGEWYCEDCYKEIENDEIIDEIEKEEEAV